MSIRINHWLIIENPFVLTPDSSFRTGSSSALPLPGGRLQFQPQPCAGIAQEHLLFGAVLELFAVEIALVEGQGCPPRAASSLDSLWPPCLVIYLQLNSADGRGQVFHLDKKKKRALLKGTDLSITLFCRHGAFIAFLSTNPFPFLNHNNSPPPLPSILPGDLVVSLLFPQTPALLPSSLKVLGAPGRS